MKLAFKLHKRCSKPWFSALREIARSLKSIVSASQIDNCLHWDSVDDQDTMDYLLESQKINFELNNIP